MRLVEICVDGGLEATMFSAQGQLADAYLAAGQGAEARTIAEDLVAREPWDRANIERFRRALALLGEEDIDQVIADRLSGETPFVSTEISGTFEVAQSAPSAPPAPAKPETVGGAPKAASSKRPAPQGEEHGMFALGEEAIDIGFLSEMKEPQTPAPAADAWVNGSESSDSSEIDLSGALENLKNDSPASRSGPPAATGDGRDLEGVFKDLRDEVSRENFVNVALQHHKLAQTYLEMGMDNEALRALEVAVRAPRLRFEAASMLARIYRKRGAATEAIDWFERAAEAPAPTPDAGRELLYDLADTLEAQGETVRALAVFLELQADVGDYRDLAVRLQRLSKLQMRG